MGEAIDARNQKVVCWARVLDASNVEALELDPDEYLGRAALSPTHRITQANHLTLTHRPFELSTGISLILQPRSLICCVSAEHAVPFQGKQCNFPAEVHHVWILIIYRLQILAPQGGVGAWSALEILHHYQYKTPMS
jgi:hypothetical protein